MLESLDIPDDLETCQQLLRELSVAYARLHEVYEELLATCTSMQDAQLKLEQEKETLELTIKELMHRLYGRRSERHADSPDQMSLDFGDDEPIEVLPDVTEDEEFVAEYEEKRRRRRRREAAYGTVSRTSRTAGRADRADAARGRAAGRLPVAGRRCGGDPGVRPTAVVGAPLGVSQVQDSQPAGTADRASRAGSELDSRRILRVWHCCGSVVQQVRVACAAVSPAGSLRPVGLVSQSLDAVPDRQHRVRTCCCPWSVAHTSACWPPR